MKNLLAAQINVGTIKGPGNAAIINPGDNAGNIFAGILSSAIGVLTVVAVIWMLFNIITGGIAIIGAGGDKAKVEGARSKITNGVTGLIVVLTASMLVSFIAYLLGLGNPLNIASTILLISP